MGKKTINRMIIFVAAAILVILGIVVYSIFVYQYDDSKELSRFLLSEDGENLSVQKVSAAFNEKYPIGTSSYSVLSDLSKQGYTQCRCEGGSCGCTITYKARFCIASALNIRFQEGKITNPIDVSLLDEGC